MKTLVKKLQPYSGVFAVFIIWLATLLSMYRTGLGLFDDRPISFLATDPSSRWLFIGGLIVSALLLIAFAHYVNVEFGVNNKFLKYFVVGQIGQIILAVSPYGETAVGVIHLLAAFTLAFSLPLLIKQFAVSQKKSRYHQVYRYLLRFEQVSFVIGIGLFVFARGLAPLGEAMPAIGFHLWIIVVTYVAIKRPRHLSSPSS
jgi:hypothetical protein